MSYIPKKSIYPIGHIYISVSDTDPGLVFEGTWVRFGQGKTLVSLSEGETEFNVIGKTGGEKTHILVAAEQANMSVHSTACIPHGDGEDIYTEYVNVNLLGGWCKRRWGIDGVTTNGGGQSHNNLQPYITVYMWKRTA